jgi:hypothetical protein
MTTNTEERIIYRVTLDGFGNHESISIWNGKTFCVHPDRAKIYPSIESARRACPKLFSHGHRTRVGTMDDYETQRAAINRIRAVKGQIPV